MASGLIFIKFTWNCLQLQKKLWFKLIVVPAVTVVLPMALPLVHLLPIASLHFK